METNKNPLPEKLIRWTDIFVGIGSFVLHQSFDFIHHEPRDSASEHFGNRGAEVQLDNIMYGHEDAWRKFE